MGESENKVDKCNQCEYYQLRQKPEDMPTDKSGLGFRVWFTFLSVIVLGLTVSNPTRDSIISILIFVIPLMREYYGFKPRRRNRIVLRIIQLGIIWSVVILCALYIVGVFILVDRNMVVTNNFPVFAEKSFDFIIVWRLLLVMATLTIADYFAYKPRK